MVQGELREEGNVNVKGTIRNDFGKLKKNPNKTKQHFQNYVIHSLKKGLYGVWFIHEHAYGNFELLDWFYSAWAKKKMVIR